MFFFWVLVDGFFLSVLALGCLEVATVAGEFLELVVLLVKVFPGLDLDVGVWRGAGTVGSGEIEPHLLEPDLGEAVGDTQPEEVDPQNQQDDDPDYRVHLIFPPRNR